MSGKGHYLRIFRSKHASPKLKKWAEKKLFNRTYRKYIKAGKIKKRRQFNGGLLSQKTRVAYR